MLLALQVLLLCLLLVLLRLMLVLIVMLRVLFLLGLVLVLLLMLLLLLLRVLVLMLLLIPQRWTGLALGVQSDTAFAGSVADALAAQLLGVTAIAGFPYDIIGHCHGQFFGEIEADFETWRWFKKTLPKDQRHQRHASGRLLNLSTARPLSQDSPPSLAPAPPALAESIQTAGSTRTNVVTANAIRPPLPMPWTAAPGP